MRLAYSRIRVGLLTFTLGLAAVWMSNVLAIAWRDVYVDLPPAETTDVFFIVPVEEKHIPFGDMGSGLCGRLMTLEEFTAKKRAEKRRKRDPGRASY